MKSGRLRGRIALLLCVMLFFPSSLCAGFGRFSLEDELELARKFDLVIETTFPVVHDTLITDYVSSLVARITATMPPQPFPIKITVIRNSAMNAFASAGGHITVFTGLIAGLDSEDELAGVLAHELAHVSERHIAKSVERGQMLSLGSLLGVLAGVLVGTGGNSDSGANALIIGSLAGGQAVQLKYTRDNEREADYYGFAFLRDAGFSPRGLAGAFKKLSRQQRLTGGGDIPSYLSTHPNIRERLAAIEDRLADLDSGIEKQSADHSEFNRVRLLVLARYGDVSSPQKFFHSGVFSPCAAALAEGIVASRRLQLELAKKRFASARECAPHDPLFLREYGRFAFEYASLDDAIGALRSAVEQNPRDLFALFFYARALAEKGRSPESITMMRRVLSAVPRDPEVLELLGGYEGAAGRDFEGHFHFAKAFAYKRQFRKYSYHLQQCQRLASSEARRRAIQELQADVADFREVLGL